MSFDQADIGVTILLAILGLSVIVAIVIVAKTIANDAKEKKERADKLATERLSEERNVPHEPQAPAPAKPAAKPVAKTHKDDVSEDDDLVAAAEVYLTYELKDQAITSLEKHLLKNPTDKKALALLKKAEASD
ncbi:MAG: hypothetical protein OQK32_00370 [Gammaproteobacteria bacterium]|nr:hypothetical protein [Gammaproteobacteria bacterium]MCW8923289.1 hypothetical protein [Gammaproteobacteria bacterium]